MAYCSECGNHNDESRLICEVCGHDLSVFDEMVTEVAQTQTAFSPDIPNDTDGDYAGAADHPVEAIFEASVKKMPVPEDTVKQVHGNENVHLMSQDDVQLGKGLIKPTQVQVGIDGYHFSYEKPAPHFGKPESFTEAGTAEKRVVVPDDAAPVFNIPAALNITDTAESTVTSDAIAQSFSEETDSPDAAENEGGIEGEKLSESNQDDDGDIVKEKPEDNEDLNVPEPVGGETLASENQLNLEPDDSAAEVPEETEFMIRTGRQTWFGVPLPGTYRVTNRAVTVTDQNNQTYEMSLESIQRVTLCQSFLAKLLGIGTVKLIPKKEDITPLTITGVVQPKELVKKIESLL